MKLSDVLFRWKKKLPRGNIWRGKYRLVREVTGPRLAKKKEEFELEEKNMFYLRHPYMTIEQARGHALPFNHKQKFLAQKYEERLENWRDHKLLGDRFGFLKVADKWE